MITPQEKKHVIEILGKHYTKKILDELAKKEIVNTKNESYSSIDIRRIVGGFMENQKIEFAIIQLAAKTKRQQEKIAEKRKLLINTGPTCRMKVD